MKYPKLRNGPNPIGESLHRALQMSDAPFLSAEGVGYGANKYGGGAEVYGGSPDGFYCLGSTNDDPALPPFKIVASPDARGSFISRGTWDVGAFSIPGLFYIGDGKAMVSDTIDHAGWGESTLFLTRDGKNFIPARTFSWSADYYALLGWRVVSASHAGADDLRGWNWGVTFVQYSTSGGPVSDGCFTYTKDGGKTWETIFISLGPGWKHGLPSVYRLTPDSFLMVLPTYVEAPTGSPYSTGWTPQDNPKASVLLKITDGGGTASPLDAGEFLSLLRVYPGDHVAGASFDLVNQRIADWLSWTRAAPMIDGYYLITTRSRYYDGQLAGDEATPDCIWVFRGGPGSAPMYLGSMSIPGVATRGFDPMPFAGYIVGRLEPDDDVTPVYLAVSEDGVTWQYRPMPYARRMVGVLTAIDKDTLACPMYDPGKSAYVLMQTKDLGITWTQRAVIARGVPAPAVGDTVLERFGILSYLKTKGFPAKTYPGAPWVGDDRITPPLEA